MLEIWFIAAILFVLLEVVLGFTVVFLFASLASFVVGVLVILDFVNEESLITQLALFFGIAVFTTMLLLKPIKKIVLERNKSAGVNNYIGQEVVVLDEKIEHGHTGNAKWSGTIVKIRLAEDSNGQSYSCGDTLKVVSVVENIFIVTKEK